MENLKLKQDVLRNAITKEVKDYLGYADDVHIDYLSVNEKTYAVGYRSRNDSERNPECKYFSILSLMERDGLWFKPDTKAIESIVQDYFPNPEIDTFVKSAIESIKQFLIQEKPSDLKSCGICVGCITLNVSCYDKSKLSDEEDDEEYNIEEDEDLGCYAHYPMRQVVSKTKTGYTIQSLPLTKIALDNISL